MNEWRYETITHPLAAAVLRDIQAIGWWRMVRRMDNFRRSKGIPSIFD